MNLRSNAVVNFLSCLRQQNLSSYVTKADILHFWFLLSHCVKMHLRLLQALRTDSGIFLDHHCSKQTYVTFERINEAFWLIQRKHNICLILYSVEKHRASQINFRLKWENRTHCTFPIWIPLFVSHLSLLSAYSWVLSYIWLPSVMLQSPEHALLLLTAVASW